MRRRKRMCDLPIEDLLAIARDELANNNSITVYYMCNGRIVYSVPNPFDRLTKMVQDLIDTLLSVFTGSAFADLFETMGKFAEQVIADYGGIDEVVDAEFFEITQELRGPHGTGGMGLRG